MNEIIFNNMKTASETNGINVDSLIEELLEKYKTIPKILESTMSEIGLKFESSIFEFWVNTYKNQQFIENLDINNLSKVKNTKIDEIRFKKGYDLSINMTTQEIMNVLDIKLGEFSTHFGTDNSCDIPYLIYKFDNYYLSIGFTNVLPKESLDLIDEKPYIFVINKK
jgi:hypothetical protein